MPRLNPYPALSKSSAPHATPCGVVSRLRWVVTRRLLLGRHARLGAAAAAADLQKKGLFVLENEKT
eukprot:COSAG04_NODE_719_length_10829_cov_6.915750_5_plen_66_part_00